MKRFFLILIIALAIILAVVFILVKKETGQASDTPAVKKQSTEEVIPVEEKASHLPTPEPLKAVYMSSWIGSSSKLRQHIVTLAEQTEVNAIVLDIKDATGRVSFHVSDPLVTGLGSPENRIRDIEAFIEELHAKNIYVIGRISTFQDPYLTAHKPEWAIKSKSTGGVWKDRKGLSFLDPANENVWEYTVALAKASYDLGFDEINFDYIRYPSDGNMKDINYNLPEGKTRADIIESFFSYLHTEMKKDDNIPISADIFGLTTTETTDMGIGQVFERALPHFDFIAPMIYPSHYAMGEYGIKNPAEAPYETIKRALAGAKAKTDVYQDDPTASEGYKKIMSYAKVRPWLQDFTIGKTTYDSAKVKAQMQATYDAGLTSWMMWDPSNKYTSSAYASE